jgi:hypothetical protein
MTEIEKWEKLFTINPYVQAHFLFDKWEVPIKIKDIKHQHQSKQKVQGVISRYLEFVLLTGDPLFTYDLTLSVQCVKVRGFFFGKLGHS